NPYSRLMPLWAIKTKFLPCCKRVFRNTAMLACCSPLKWTPFRSHPQRPALPADPAPDALQLVVAQLGIPVRAAALRRQIQQVPQRPDDIYVPPVLAGLATAQVHQLAGPGVIDLAVLLVKHIHDGQRLALFVLTLV